MILPLVLVFVVVVIVLGVNRKQMPLALTVALLVGVFFPVVVTTIPHEATRFARGITGPAITVWVLTLVVGLSAVFVIARMRMSSWFFLIAPGFAWLLVGALLVWPRNLEVVAGVVHLTVGFGAFVVGLYAGTRIDAQGQLWLIRFLAALFVFELLLSIYQVSSGEADVFFGRSFATFSHPAFFGKMALLALVLILPQLDSADKRAGRMAWIALLAAASATVLTQSRANTIAIAVVVLLWALLLPSGGVRGLRTALVSAMAVGAAFVVPIMLERFLADPDGGDREDLRLAGVRVVERYFATGTGPNRFATVGGRTETIIASTGYPIHDSWLLAVGELGFIGALLVGLPLILAILVAIGKGTAKSRIVRLEARTFVLVAAGVVFVGLSGWGMLQEPTLQMMFFVAGYAFGRVRRTDLEDSAATVIGADLSIVPKERAVPYGGRR